MSKETESNDNEPMGLGELIRTVRYHDRDLYKGNGKAAITVRLNDLEAYRTRTENDLYQSEHGMIPQLTKFFAVLAEREKQTTEREEQTDTKMARYLVIVAGIAVLAAPLWDILKHSMGWFR